VLEEATARVAHPQRVLKARRLLIVGSLFVLGVDLNTLFQRRVEGVENTFFFFGGLPLLPEKPADDLDLGLEDDGLHLHLLGLLLDHRRLDVGSLGGLGYVHLHLELYLNVSK